MARPKRKLPLFDIFVFSSFGIIALGVIIMESYFLGNSLKNQAQIPDNTYTPSLPVSLQPGQYVLFQSVPGLPEQTFLVGQFERTFSPDKAIQQIQVYISITTKDSKGFPAGFDSFFLTDQEGNHYPAYDPGEGTEDALKPATVLPASPVSGLLFFKAPGDLTGLYLIYSQAGAELVEVQLPF